MFREAHETAIDRKLHDPRLRDLYAAYLKLTHPRRPGNALRPAGREPDTAPPGPCPIVNRDDLHERAGDLMGELRGHMVLVVPEGSEFRYRLYGSLLMAQTGFDLTGKSTSSLNSDVGRFFTICYRQVLDTGRPLMTLHRAEHAPAVHLWERLLLPVRDRDGTVACLGAIVARETKAELLETIISQADAGIFAIRFHHDERGQIEDGCIVHANPAAATLVGRALPDLLGAPVRACFPALEGHGIWQRYLHVHATRKPLRFSVAYDGDGINGTFNVSVGPLVDGVLVMFTPTLTEAGPARTDRQRMRALETRIAELEAEIARRDLDMLPVIDPARALRETAA